MIPAGQEGYSLPVQLGRSIRRNPESSGCILAIRDNQINGMTVNQAVQLPIDGSPSRTANNVTYEQNTDRHVILRTLWRESHG